MAEQLDQNGPQTAQLVVIGAGPGGYAAAFAAADLGLEVTLIDPAVKPGGVCLYRGCIPSKSLLHVAKLVTEAAEADAIGVAFAEPQLDIDRIRAWKDEVIGKLTDGLAMTVQQKKITYLRGTAKLTDAHTLAVTTVDGADLTLTFEQAILATGSRPIALPGAPEDDPRVVDSTGALALPDVPRRLLVVGGGYIGLELGSVYAALGSEVSVVEMMPGLLPGVDRDLVSVLKRRLDGKFAAIMLNTKVDAMKLKDDGVEVTFRSPGFVQWWRTNPSIPASSPEFEPGTVVAEQVLDVAPHQGVDDLQLGPEVVVEAS